LAQNAGRTRKISSSSPAYNSTIIGQSPFADQRGKPASGVPDRGALELQADELVSPTHTPIATATALLGSTATYTPTATALPGSTATHTPIPTATTSSGGGNKRVFLPQTLR
jgi:hypothetical protein